MSALRLAITGATGMVGTHVTRRATAAGYQVRALVRKGDHSQHLRELGADVVEWDLLKPETFPAASETPDSIVRLNRA